MIFFWLLGNRSRSSKSQTVIKKMLATLLLLSRLPWADEVDWPTCRTNVRKEEEIVTPMNLRLIHFAFQSCSLNLENEAK